MLVPVVAAAAQAPATRVLCAPDGRGETPPDRTSDDPLQASGRPAVLVGRVVSVTGAPVAHAAVALQLQDGGGGAAPRAARLDSTGGFQFVALPAGRYRLRVAAIGSGEQWQAVELYPGGTDAVCVRLRPARRILPPGGPSAARGRRGAV